MKKETEEWLRIAEEEFVSAQILLKEGVFRMVCYHAQQAAEKVLKAVLTERDIEFSRTHNILDLKNGVQKLGYEVELTTEDSMFLNSIYKSRYPVHLGLLPTGDPTSDDAKLALAIAEKMVGFAQNFKK
jgi:HEPN domain-containing protein